LLLLLFAGFVGVVGC